MLLENNMFCNKMYVGKMITESREEQRTGERQTSQTP